MVFLFSTPESLVTKNLLCSTLAVAQETDDSELNSLEGFSTDFPCLAGFCLQMEMLCYFSISIIIDMFDSSATESIYIPHNRIVLLRSATHPWRPYLTFSMLNNRSHTDTDIHWLSHWRGLSSSCCNSCTDPPPTQPLRSSIEKKETAMHRFVIDSSSTLQKKRKL